MAGIASAPIERYVVLEYLAEGGMGAIYLGKKTGAGGFEKQVVLKQLLPEFIEQPEFIELFLREAKLSATLDHANIIHTIDLVTAGRDYFIVMEYLDGADLRTLLRRAKRRRRRFSPQAGIYLAREVLSALAYAHHRIGPDGTPLNLIHRDVSPSNILVSAYGEVKLTDFGIAKASTHNSVFYRVKGKVGYMSPEQARSDVLDVRSDLFSLAVCVYELIAGERLFVGTGLTQSSEEMYSQRVPPLSEKVRGLPASLDRVFMKALAIDPRDRFQSAAAFHEELLRCAHQSNLMLSTPEMAEHLHDVCGNPKYWRTNQDLDVSSQAVEIGGEGTQQISPGELLENDPYSNDLNDSDLLSVYTDKPELPGRALTSMTKLTELKGIELTSMMLEQKNDNQGATPLFGVENFGKRTVEDSSTSLPQAPVGMPGALGSKSARAAASPPSGRAPVPELDSDLTGIVVGFDEEYKNKVIERTDPTRSKGKVPKWFHAACLLTIVLVAMGVFWWAGKSGDGFTLAPPPAATSPTR